MTASPAFSVGGTKTTGYVPTVQSDGSITWAVVNSQAFSFVTKTGNYTAVVNDFVQANTTSAGFTVTLPLAPATGAQVAVKNIGSAGFTLTVAAAGGGTIDGAATATTTTQWAGAIFEHTGSNVWLVVSAMTTTGPQGPAGATGATGATGPTGPAGPAGGQLPRVLPSGGRVTTGGGSIASLTLTNGFEYGFPFEVFTSTTFTNIGINLSAVDGSGSVIRVGVRNTDANGRPSTLVAEAATTIDSSSGTGTTGIKEPVFAQTLAAGVYWLVALGQGGNPVITGTNSLPVFIPSLTQAGVALNVCSALSTGGGVTSGGLPTSWGATYQQNVTAPRVFLKVT